MNPLASGPNELVTDIYSPNISNFKTSSTSSHIIQLASFPTQPSTDIATQPVVTTDHIVIIFVVSVSGKYHMQYADLTMSFSSYCDTALCHYPSIHCHCTLHEKEEERYYCADFWGI